MKIRYLCLASLSAALVACNTMPAGNSALDAASEHFRSAQLDSQVTTWAPDELKRAGDSLHLAERAWEQGERAEKIDHLSYMAEQRVVIARETASSKAAQAVTAGAAAARDKMRLDLRTAEADTAQQQLAVAQQSNLQKTAERDRAMNEAEQDRQALALRSSEFEAAQWQLAQAQQDDASKGLALERSAARLNDLESQLSALNARQTPRGMVVTLGDVLFDTGQSSMLAGGDHNLAKLAEFFTRNPLRRAMIEGYTDNVGTTASNYELADRRANTVMVTLVRMGVPSDRLQTHAYGEESPVANNDTAAGRQMNRRVEIVFAQLSDEVTVK